MPRAEQCDLSVLLTRHFWPDCTDQTMSVTSTLTNCNSAFEHCDYCYTGSSNFGRPSVNACVWWPVSVGCRCARQCCCAGCCCCKAQPCTPAIDSGSYLEYGCCCGIPQYTPWPGHRWPPTKPEYLWRPQAVHCCLHNSCSSAAQRTSL